MRYESEIFRGIQLRTAKRYLLIVLILIETSSLYAQTKPGEKINSRVFAGLAIPAFGDQDIFNLGFGGEATVEYFIWPFFAPMVNGGLFIMPVDSLDTLVLLQAGLGGTFQYRPIERLSLQGDVYGGLYTAAWQDYGTSGLYFAFRAQAGFRLTPAITLSVFGGFSDYLSSPDPFLRSFSAGISLTIQYSEISNRTTKVDIDYNNIDPIFPVFYSFYDDHSFGTVEVTNSENMTISDVRVSLFIPEYMSQPRQCAEFESLSIGQTASIPLYALFNDKVLELTENTRAQADIIVNYRKFGAKREVSVPVELTMHHRNAMTWEDDRKAAAFVSPTDPAVLWFSRFSAGIVRDRMRGSINKNLQYAMGMFEALRLYGINYVIDPNSSYIELSSQAEAVDYLQFPHQTLFYRGGDCDDLSILFSALLESIGIETAFITVPGHIYMAFSLGMTEEEAKKAFYDPAMLIYDQGEAWLPVEITMVKEGFLKAWRIGAKEWTDNAKTGDARIYKMTESWDAFRPAGIPNVNPRFALPEDAEAIRSFNRSMDRYVAREIGPLVERLAVSSEDATPEELNDLGVLFGRYGMLNEAWNRFARAAEAGYAPAWTNLASVAFLQKDYDLALSYYNWGLHLNEDEDASLLGVARSQYELENLEESDKAYAVLQQRDPDLADRFGYLASIFGGEGRAWSFTDRLSSTVWLEAGVFGPEMYHALGTVETRIAGESSAVETPAEAPEIAETIPSDPRDLDTLEPKVAVLLTDPAEKPEPFDPTKPPKILDAPPEDIDLIDPNAVKEEAVKEEEAYVAELIEKTLNPEEIKLFSEVLYEGPAQTGSRDLVLLDLMNESVYVDQQTIVFLETAGRKSFDQLAEEGLKTDVILEPESPESPGSRPSPVQMDLTDETIWISRNTFVFKETVKPAIEGPEPVETPEPEIVTIVEPVKPPQPVWGSLVSDFSAARPRMGSWTVLENIATQDDAKQLFAKLAVPVRQGGSKTAYEFTARSTGSGWTGLGVHIYLNKLGTPYGYGAGKSILVWVTYDPKHYGDDMTRLQIYRSELDTYMEQIHSIQIPESIFENNRYAVVFDKETGTISVQINEKDRLEMEGFGDFTEGEFIIFRALDTARFEDFSIKELVQ